MKKTIEEYNEETTWEIRESSVVRDGHIKIATATAAQIAWNGEITTTTEILVGVFGSKDRLDHFAIWNTKDNLSDEEHRELISTFLHQGPIDR